jgi:hypothetical protein
MKLATLAPLIITKRPVSQGFLVETAADLSGQFSKDIRVEKHENRAKTDVQS